MITRPEYTLTRQKRKTIAMYVRENGLEVRAPLRVSKAEIDSFVESKRTWIERALAAQAQRTGKKSAFELDYGSRLLYCGREYAVGEFGVPPGLAPEGIKCACVAIYRQRAKRDLTVKVQRYAALMGVQPAGVKISGAKTRWGSCSSKKSLNFSWRLVMAEEDVIDYVVVHELAHIKQMNHSPDFWAIVQNIMPDYKVRRQQLKTLQKRLENEDWE